MMTRRKPPIKVRLQAEWAARVARHRKRKVPPDPPPRYDEEFFEIGRIIEEQEGAIPDGAVVPMISLPALIRALMNRYGIDARLMDVYAEVIASE